MRDGNRHVAGTDDSRYGSDGREAPVSGSFAQGMKRNAEAAGDAVYRTWRRVVVTMSCVCDRGKREREQQACE